MREPTQSPSRRRLPRWRLIAGLTIVLSGLAAAAGAAFPGPHRMLCPTCFGLTKIAPGLFTDGSRAQQALAKKLVSKADQATSAFFGGLISKPRYVFCASAPCIETFARGRAASGVAFAALAVRIAPRGWHTHIVTHERMHIELQARLGAVFMSRQSVPTWFDEGLAVLIANDKRFIGKRAARFGAMTWIAKARSQSDWNRLRDEHGWRNLYGAAAARVATYARTIGNEGLRNVIARVANGQDFETALFAEVARRTRRRQTTAE